MTEGIYRLLSSGFGAFVIVFSGLGGFVTLYMQRQGRAGESISLLGVFLLLIAGSLFVFRVLLTAGVIGRNANGFPIY